MDIEDKTTLNYKYYVESISYYTKAHETVEWAGVDTRYGYNGDDTLAHHDSILQWSRRD